MAKMMLVLAVFALLCRASIKSFVGEELEFFLNGKFMGRVFNLLRVIGCQFTENPAICSNFLLVNNIVLKQMFHSFLGKHEAKCSPFMNPSQFNTSLFVDYVEPLNIGHTNNSTRTLRIGVITDIHLDLSYQEV